MIRSGGGSVHDCGNDIVMTVVYKFKLQNALKAQFL